MSSTGNGRNSGGKRNGRRAAEKHDSSEPRISDEVKASDLDPDVRRDLQALDKQTADRVARHLVMASDLLEEAPEQALAHARAARARAARIAVVRETAGIVAYSVGEWQEAVTELRAARRMSGSDALLPLIADSERGLGHPDRAVEIADSDDARNLTGDTRLEMVIVKAGALLDMGEAADAVRAFAAEDLTPGRTGTDAARLFFAYASTLEAVGRRNDAITWFQNAASADIDDETDAEFRLMDLLDGDASVDNEVQPEGADVPLRDQYDVLLLDLDGTLYTGTKPVPEAIAAVAATDGTALFVTNNASRTPSEVCAHLTGLGFEASEDQVVTSAQVGAALVAEAVDPGSKVLVVGSEALRAEIRSQGLTVVESADDEPAAVVQGHSPDTGWAQLSEGALAIRRGATWIATNVDTTLPTERGLLIGNGSMVAAVASATGATPRVAGKPAAPIMRSALARSNAQRPLMIGDRLDTDIEGAHTVGIDSLLVLSGVTTGVELLAARPEERPTYIAADLGALADPASSSMIGPRPEWYIEVNAQHVSVSSRGDGDAVGLAAALANAVWTADVGSFDLRIAAEDDASAAALAELGLSALR
ncbi:HAD-IIA family hydrolase [Gordonia hydrophobica]|uniref:HAD-IIA family hydrolase n=1 Tax=Gordonia hydrophobica TaxID=40516 RepID=A0ABZ2U1X3_9ACTN|nr:HAD-IIA family hydrolase [Gordonia hydrophobica]MBM7369427.1 HAD superfamily hydrolase (TIGR01450 family) [Gordonia hydrophobica]